MKHTLKINNKKFELKTLREKLFLSQEKLAHKLGISVKTVVRWENGASPSLTSLKKIANFFNL